MMRSLFSGVSGIRAHQTRMDVIGNNIANVNTVAYKSQSMTFNEVFYQTTQTATGPNATTGRGGTNAKQIGLGSSVGAISTSITSEGSTERTDNATDLAITGANAFFIVSSGGETFFTRAGNFTRDEAGALVTQSGANVMGWQVDPTTGQIKKDQVSALRIMQESNLTSPAEATTNAVCGGIVDKNSTEITSESGYAMNLNFFDALGYSYTAKFAVKGVDTDAGTYTVELSAIYDSSNKNILEEFLANGGNLSDVFGANASGGITNAQTAYNAISTEWTDTGASNSFGGNTYHQFRNSSGEMYYINTTQNAATGQYDSKVYRAITSAGGVVKGYEAVTDVSLSDIYTGLQPGATINSITDGNPPTIEATAVNYELKFDTGTGKGKFVSVGDSTNGSVTLNMKQLGDQFENISIDFTQCKNSNNGGTSTVGMDAGAIDGTTGTGKKLGALTGVYVDTNGKIYGSYDNGNTVLLGQIASARFANAAGLEKVGDNCYRTTLNSGEFDGIGVEITSNGSTMNSGELEMSNVDLASEFTEMITTQRGFQANSRVITTSDTLLEELINLKR